MSLIKRFSARTLCVGLAPDRLTSIIRDGKTFVKASAFHQEISNPSGHWQSALNVFQNILQQSGHPGMGLPISVVLSSRWCRMMMVPWSDAILKENAAGHFLLSQYIAVYGDEARDWIITADDAPYGRPRSACGIERGLLEALQRLAQDNKSTCKSVEPIISAAWRAVANFSGSATKAFAVVEQDRLTLACTEQGEITAVQSQICSEAWAVELVRAWQRWVLRMPTFANITHVAVLNLTGKPGKEELPNLFKLVPLPSYELEPAFSLLTYGGSQ